MQPTDSQPRNSRRGFALLPAFMEAGRIGRVVRETLAFIEPVVVVDDGSTDRTAAEAGEAGAIVIRHEFNRGKGAALNTGFAFALKEGFGFVITMDADGQHAPSDIPRFIAAWETRGAAAVIVGNRMGDPRGMPPLRRATNYLMSWYLSAQMGQFVPDTQCGFRLYGAETLPVLAAKSPRFAAESESLLRLAASNIVIASVPIAVIYGDEKSKIRPLRDTVRFLAMTRRIRRELKEEKKRAQAGPRAPA